MKWLALVLLPTVVVSQCITENDTIAAGNDSSAVKIALYKGQQKFSLDMLRIMNEFKNGQNLFFSPHSIYQALLLAYFTASNDTEKIIQKALHIPETQSKIETIQSMATDKFLASMRENGDYKYKIANKMFLSTDLVPRPCMVDLFKEELLSVNFSDPLVARHFINEWVENTTLGEIKDFLPMEAVHEETKLILANAAYFRGFWKSKFLPENTKNNDLFYVSTSKIRVIDSMRQKGTFNHLISERLKAHILELPYKGGDVSMIIILPRFYDNAIDELINQISEESLQEVLELDALNARPIEVQIPKFTVEESIDLSMAFKKLGLSEVLKNNSDFSSLTGTTDSEISFNDAIHKAKVEVDEEGTVAAAATAIFSFRSSRPLDPTIFKANHPFLYLIFDKVSQNILFMGVYKLPPKKYDSSRKNKNM